MKLPDGLTLEDITQFNPDPLGGRWIVGQGDKRQGRTGTSVGTICGKHSSGYAVVLRYDDGRKGPAYGCHHPHTLRPAPRPKDTP